MTATESKDSTQPPEPDGMAAVAYVVGGFCAGVIATLIVLGVFG